MTLIYFRGFSNYSENKIRFRIASFRRINETSEREEINLYAANIPTIYIYSTHVSGRPLKLILCALTTREFTVF
jgi:hypothetical protein